MTSLYRIAAGLALIGGLALATGAQAGETRAADQKLGPACGAHAQAPCGEGKRSPKSDVGPPNGFPDAPGIAVARQVASGNAAFIRADSPGG